METNELRDKITIKSDDGLEREYAVEALFDMEDQSYALLSAKEDMLLMRIEDEGDEQYLVGIDDPDEKESILAAYQLAVEETGDEEDVTRH